MKVFTKANFLTTIISLVVAAPSFAASIPTITDIEKLEDSFSPLLSSMKGVNGFGIPGCDAVTGEWKPSKDSVNCMGIYTETPEATAALNTLFPVGTKVQNIFIVIHEMGPFTAN